MSYMFYHCYNNIPDISKWNTSNVNNMSYMFSFCKDLPDISKWDTSNVNNMGGMFSFCDNLPDISKWNTSNINNFNLSILKPKPKHFCNFFFKYFQNTIITICTNEFMTFSNVVKLLSIKIKENMSNIQKFTFLNSAQKIDLNSNKCIKELFPLDKQTTFYITIHEYSDCYFS